MLQKIFILLALCSSLQIFPATSYALDKKPSLTNPNITQVSPHVFALVGDMDVPNEENNGFICNSAFVITSNGVVVVDPGGSVQIGRMIIKEIRKRTNKPITHVFNTHHHADHWMGNLAFAELDSKPVIMGHSIMKDKAFEIGERWIKIISDMTKNKNKGTKVVLPNKLVKGNENLNIGGLTFSLYHPTHAHTKGDIAIYIPEEKTLIAGDILFYKRTPGFQDASPLGNEKALQYMENLDVKTVIPGHGPVTSKDGIRYMLKYINLLHSQVKHYFEKGLEDYEMKNKINVKDYKNMSGFKERFGINVNRMYLEVEQNNL